MEDSVKTQKSDTAPLVAMFMEAESASFNGRNESERARDYVDGKQLTEQERMALRKRGQPEIIINRIRRKIQWLRGLEIKQRTDPKAFPRNPKDEQGAEAATDGLRFVADETRFDRLRSAVWDNMLVEGFGGVEVIHRQNKRGEVEIVCNRYPWDRLFHDPHSRETDFSDARYLGAMVWQDEAELKEQYPGKARALEGVKVAEKAPTNETWGDKPQNKHWHDAKRNRMRCVMIWHKKDGKWQWAKFVQEVMLDSGVSPYVDEDGESVCPLIMQSLYVDRDNDRYGVVRDMFGPQDEINKRRSKALHLLNTRQVRVAPGVVDRAQISRELAKPDGVIPAEKDDFEVLLTSDMAQGQAALLEEAKNEIDLMGANAALEGETGSSTSGRAVLARQQGGMIEIAPEVDELQHFTQRVYEAFWQRIKQFWTAEKWVRVTDDENSPRFTVLNRPILFGEMLGQQPPELVAQVAQQLMLVPNDPRLQAVVGVENDVAELGIDIILEEVPDRITLAGETFEALAKYGPALPPQVLIEADPTLPASKKQKLLELLEKAQSQPNPQQQAELMESEATAAKDMAMAQKTAAEAQTLPLAAATGL